METHVSSTTYQLLFNVENVTLFAYRDITHTQTRAPTRKRETNVRALDLLVPRRSVHHTHGRRKANTSPSFLISIAPGTHPCDLLIRLHPSLHIQSTHARPLSRPSPAPHPRLPSLRLPPAPLSLLSVPHTIHLPLPPLPHVRRRPHRPPRPNRARVPPLPRPCTSRPRPRQRPCARTNTPSRALEQEVTRDPDSLKPCFFYLSHLSDPSHYILFQSYKRAVAALSGSYKLWRKYTSAFRTLSIVETTKRPFCAFSHTHTPPPSPPTNRVSSCKMVVLQRFKNVHTNI